MLGFHAGDELFYVPRGGVNARLQLNGVEDFHPEAFGEVFPLLVVGDEFETIESLGVGLPMGNLRVELGEVGIPIAREVRLVLRGNHHERLVNVLNGRLGQHRIQHVMGVAVRMNVPLGVVGGFGHRERGDAWRAIHVAGLPGLDAGILAGFQQGGQERVFAPEPHGHHQVSSVHHRHEARFHGHAVGVFDARGEAEHFNVFTPNLAREVSQVGERGHHTNLSSLRRRRDERRSADGGC